MPIFDTFGPLPQATFGGQGIPNDEVAVSKQIVDGDSVITIAMSATQRFSNPPLSNDGAGTYFATTGSNFGGAGESAIEGALWNWNVYLDVSGGTKVLADYQINVFYDFDPADNTPITSLGSINLTNSLLFGPMPAPGATLVEDSQNLLFGFLAAPFPGFVSPPAGAFDPNAVGEYTFAITVADPLSGFPIETVAMDVTVIPEPHTAVLLLAGLAGAIRRR